jgi:hypothetical protein
LQYKCEENIVFWELVQIYKLSPRNELKGIFEEIYEEFIEKGSKYEINLDHKLRAELEEMKLLEKFDKTIFDNILSKIKINMMDSFSNFANTQEFKNFSIIEDEIFINKTNNSENKRNSKRLTNFFTTNMINTLKDELKVFDTSYKEEKIKKKNNLRKSEGFIKLHMQLKDIRKEIEHDDKLLKIEEKNRERKSEEKKNLKIDLDDNNNKEVIKNKENENISILINSVNSEENKNKIQSEEINNENKIKEDVKIIVTTDKEEIKKQELLDEEKLKEAECVLCNLKNDNLEFYQGFFIF